MKIKDKINMTIEGLVKNGPINIVAFGDSVTHGAVEIGKYDYEGVYWNRLRKKILAKRNVIPVNVIDAGIGGATASDSLERMDTQVFNHAPDLIIVCFGLNDVNDPLEKFLGALRVIFTRIIEKGVDLIYMTPNMLNTYVAKDAPKEFLDYAHKTAEMQNGGRMDEYMRAAAELAREMNVPLCDCYSEWKELSKTRDTTMLLANRINHPVTEMHELFADRLMKMIFLGDADCFAATESAMCDCAEK